MRPNYGKQREFWNEEFLDKESNFDETSNDKFGLFSVFVTVVVSIVVVLVIVISKTR